MCLNANSTPGWLVLPLEFAASLMCASNGEYALYALKKTDAERVISFEPDQKLLTKLQRNLQLNGLEADPGLELYAKYLSDKEGSDSVDASFLADRILTPCLIEMDIDGEETAVLHAAAKGFLSKPGSPRLVETQSKALEAEWIFHPEFGQLSHRHCCEFLVARAYTGTVSG